MNNSEVKALCSNTSGDICWCVGQQAQRVDELRLAVERERAALEQLGGMIFSERKLLSESNSRSRSESPQVAAPEELMEREREGERQHGRDAILTSSMSFAPAHGGDVLRTDEPSEEDRKRRAAQKRAAFLAAATGIGSTEDAVVETGGAVMHMGHLRCASPAALEAQESAGKAVQHDQIRHSNLRRTETSIANVPDGTCGYESKNRVEQEWAPFRGIALAGRSHETDILDLHSQQRESKIHDEKMFLNSAGSSILPHASEAKASRCPNVRIAASGIPKSHVVAGVNRRANTSVVSFLMMPDLSAMTAFMMPDLSALCSIY